MDFLKVLENAEEITVVLASVGIGISLDLLIDRVEETEKCYNIYGENGEIISINKDDFVRIEKREDDDFYYLDTDYIKGRIRII